MKHKKVFSFVLGMLVLVSVLGMFSSIPTIPTIAAMTQPDTASNDIVMVSPDKTLTMIKTQPACTLKITDVYGIQSTSSSYARVVVEGFSEGCYKVEVTINCAGQEQRQTVAVDRSGFWQATFDGTVSECICYRTPISVKARCVDPEGVDCRDAWELSELPCRVIADKCYIGIEEVFGVGTVPGIPYVEKIHVRGVARGCELVEVIVKCNSPYELRARAIVDPATGRWEAILEPDVTAECICSNLIEVRACCIVPYLPNCCAYLKLEQLPCPTPTECQIRIEGVYPEYDPVSSGYVRSVIVWGIAKGCKTVQVTIICGARQTEIAVVDPSGHWKVKLDGTLAECFCERPIYVEACCIDAAGAIICCDNLKLERLPCPEKPPEECYIEIVDVFGVPRATAAGVNVHVRGIAKGCRIVEVIINCVGQEIRTRTEVDPATGRWEAVIDGLLAECDCGQKIVVRACCLVPELADCCDVWESSALPCPKPEECEIWIEGVYPELDPDFPNRVLRVIVVGAAKGCNKVQVFMNCAGNEQMETAEVIDGYWKVILDGITAECYCDNPITVKACCLDEAGNFICCDELFLERLPCPEIPPVKECFVEIIDVFGEPMVTAAGVRVHVRGIAKDCRLVEVTIICGAEFRAQAEVDPFTGRWEAVLDGLQAECQCKQKITVRACCIIPERLECCDVWELVALPCPSPEECRIWISGVYPEYDPATGQVHKVIVVGVARGCKTVQVFMNCAGNEQIELTEVYDSGEWEVVLDGIVAECFCDGPIWVKACCIDDAGNVLCCDELMRERLPCPEIPPEEECFLEIVEVYGVPMVTAAGVQVHVRGIAIGCRLVEVTIICGAEFRAKAEVDPFTGRWEAVLDGLLAECQCEQKITVRACCIIPERPDCCDVWELDALPCPSPDECRIWIKGVYPELDPTDTVARRVHQVIIWGTASGCTKIRVIMNCAGQEQVTTAIVNSDGHWQVALDGIPAECFCDETRIYIEACCEEAPNCCDFLELEILPCPEKPPVTTPIEPKECHVEIVEVIPEFEVNAAGEEVLTRITVVGRAQECWKVEVRLACREKLGTTVEVIDSEWKVVFEDVQEVCVCGEHLEVAVICVDPVISDCFDKIILEDACKPREVTSEEEETTETGPGFIPGFGLIETLFAVLTLLGLAKIRHARR